MGLLEFNKLPINTLVGADWKTFNAITKGREIDAAYKGKYRLTKAVCRLLSTLAPLQNGRYEKRLASHKFKTGRSSERCISLSSTLSIIIPTALVLLVIGSIRMNAPVASYFFDKDQRIIPWQ